MSKGQHSSTKRVMTERRKIIMKISTSTISVIQTRGLDHGLKTLADAGTDIGQSRISRHIQF